MITDYERIYNRNIDSVEIGSFAITVNYDLCKLRIPVRSEEEEKKLIEYPLSAILSYYFINYLDRNNFRFIKSDIKDSFDKELFNVVYNFLINCKSKGINDTLDFDSVIIEYKHENQVNFIMKTNVPYIIMVFEYIIDAKSKIKKDLNVIFLHGYVMIEKDKIKEGESNNNEK